MNANGCGVWMPFDIRVQEEEAIIYGVVESVANVPFVIDGKTYYYARAVIQVKQLLKNETGFNIEDEIIVYFESQKAGGTSASIYTEDGEEWVWGLSYQQGGDVSGFWPTGRYLVQSIPDIEHVTSRKRKRQFDLAMANEMNDYGSGIFTLLPKLNAPFAETMARLPSLAQEYAGPLDAKLYPIEYDPVFAERLTVADLAPEENENGSYPNYYEQLEILAEKSGTVLEMYDDCIYFTDRRELYEERSP